MVNAWLDEQQLRPFLEALGGFVRYRVDDSDVLAITHQLATECAGPVRRATYLLGERIELEFESEPGDGIIAFRATAPTELELRIEGAVAALQAAVR